MKENEKRAQLVRGVMRRTRSEFAPEWAPSAVSRFGGCLAPGVFALGMTVLFLALRTGFSRTAAVATRGVPYGEIVIVAGICLFVALLLAILGRRVLEHGIAPVALSCSVSLLMLGWLLAEYGLRGRDGIAVGWLFLALVSFVLGGFRPVGCLVSWIRYRRCGYQEGTHRPLHAVFVIFEIVIIAVGVFAGTRMFAELAR